MFPISFHSLAALFLAGVVSGRFAALPESASFPSSGYWLTELGPLGKAPLEGTGYKVWRNVKDYGATGRGDLDDARAINAAISDGTRCGRTCGNTFSQGAIIYFPSGTYKVCTPIIQLYYTQFVGDPHDRPVIKGCSNFTGIGLIDTDPYIPGGFVLPIHPMPVWLLLIPAARSGDQWYISENQFFRQIRNFEFDLRDMPFKTDDAGQPLAPTGLHWQASQATSLQNLKFTMPVGQGTTHVGIFTENGSGGFVSDLEFVGGNIGWRAGGQQFTARGLKFSGSTTAVQTAWDWGWTWQQIEISDCAIGFNISGTGGDSKDGKAKQGTGSVSIVDSKFSNVPIGILTSERNPDPPSIVLDNVQVSNVGVMVKSEQGTTLLNGGSATVELWAVGRRYKAGRGSYELGHVMGAPPKPNGLLDSQGRLFVRSRPQYEDVPSSSFLVATTYGISNAGDGDQTQKINQFLVDAKEAGKIAYFPAGIYMITGTVTIPTGSRLQGSSWSQIMATGNYFGDMENPKVAIRVGEKGDVGTVEIVEMLFTTKGATAGAIMVEWNVSADTPGSAGMWDSHVRIGGGKGTDLDFASCPKKSQKESCYSTSMLLHVTSKASGYFENVWAWIADHDNDYVVHGEPDLSKSQISIFGARGILIESQDPSWFYGTGSEHATLYQYQLHKAKNVYMGHIQTEPPYFQPVPAAPQPFNSALGLFPADPDFADCTTAACRMAWGLRIIDSKDVYFHSVGLYSWFNDYTSCVAANNCQERILQIIESENIALYNIFTKASLQVGSGGPGNTVFLNDSNQIGYTSEVSVWFPGSGYEAEVVYLGDEVYTGQIAQCTAPCIFVLPPSKLPPGSTTTISIPPYPTTIDAPGRGVITVTITVAAITTTEIPMGNVNVTIGQPANATFYPSPSIDLPPAAVSFTDGDGRVTTTSLIIPPWPSITMGAPDTWPSTTGPWGPGGGLGGNSSIPTGTPSGSVPTGSRDPDHWPYLEPVVVTCPPSTFEMEAFSATITLKDCTGTTTLDWSCPPTATMAMDADASVSIALGCTMFTGTIQPTATSAIPIPAFIDILPVPTPPTQKQQDDDNDDGSHYLPCNVWFFWTCVDWPEFPVFGWWVTWKPGQYAGGPPPIRWPPGVTFKGKPPSWPAITVPTKGPIQAPVKPSNCQTETAEICRTTTSYGEVVSGTVTRTTATSTGEQCATILGCKVEDESTATTTASACTVSPHPQRVRRQDGSESPCDTWQGMDAVVYPSDPKNVAGIRNWLTEENLRFTEARAPSVGDSGFTAFFYVESVTGDDWEGEVTDSELLTSLGIQDRYMVEPYQEFRADELDSLPTKVTPPDPRFSDNVLLSKRGAESQQLSEYWELSQISAPRGYNWMDPIFQSDGSYKYYYHDSAGEGQYIYAVEESIYLTHDEFAGKVAAKQAAVLPEIIYGNEQQGASVHVHEEHGTQVASKAVGKVLGVAKKATIVVPQMSLYGPTGPAGSGPDWSREHNIKGERTLDAFVRIMEHIMTGDDQGPNKMGRSVINYSWGEWEDTSESNPAVYKMFYKILKELDSMKVLVVAAAHNEYQESETEVAYLPHGRGDDMSDIPARWANPAHPWYLPNLIVVSTTDINTQVGNLNPYANWASFAPGAGVAITDGISGDGIQENEDGASFAAPLVAGLAAYLRALPSKWKKDLEDPRLLKALIKLLQRQLSDFPGQPAKANVKFKVPTVWNGQVFGLNCLVDSDTLFYGNSPCPNIDDIYKPDADKAVLSPGGGGGGGGGSGIVFQPGRPSSTCTASCGKLCTGFFCGTNPTGNPNAPSSGGGPLPTLTSAPSSGGGPLPTLTSVQPGCEPSQTAPLVKVCYEGRVGSDDDRDCVTMAACVAVPTPTWSEGGPCSARDLRVPRETWLPPVVECHMDYNDDCGVPDPNCGTCGFECCVVFRNGTRGFICL
ncbi:pectate lyase superfamily protein-domain-containing protein [Podospora conica]|nr:pectate lyase superfamily protein-domain-containing protein [Schizothecium conicum]